MLRQPKNIQSPFTGQTVRPVIKEIERNGYIYKEAHYVCPQTNNFITKIVLDSKKISDV